jgi:WD40 repeat protein
MLDTELRTAPPRAASPFPGLIPYSEENAPYFFGREHDRGIISANLQASRLTVLYGASGVGKSSVLRAGVVHRLRDQARNQQAAGLKPESYVVEFATWRDDPITGLADAIRASIELTPPDPIPDPPPPTRQLDELLGYWTEQLGADLLIILDQFEEFFLYHGREDGEDSFAAQFSRAVNAPELRANFLLAIREDALAKLDLFKGRIPNLFGNYLRIRHLDREAARDAITQPIHKYNAIGGKPVTIEPGLVEKVLDQVTTGRLVVGQAGRGGVAESELDVNRIETPYLQLVMSRLWREEEASERACVLRLTTLEHLGGAERIVRTHLDEAMEGLTPSQAGVAARIFRFLVTRGGTKVAHTAADLADWADVSEPDTSEVLERLARGDVRILRAVAPPPGEDAPSFEIFHDVLAPAVLDWRARYELRRRHAEAEERLQAEREQAEERARKSRRRLMVLTALLGGAVLAMGAALWAVLEIRDQRNTAQSQALVGRALSALSVDPRKSVRLALQALDEKRTRSAVAVLRRAYSTSRVRAVLTSHDDIVWTAEFGPGGHRVVTASRDHTARISEVASGAKVAVLKGHQDEVTGAAFSPDGNHVVTASDDGTARVWDANTGKELHVLNHGPTVRLTNTDQFLGDGYVATGPFSTDGRYLVTSAGHSARMWDLTTGRQVGLFTLPKDDFVVSAAFSPDGGSVVTGGLGGARIWDVTTGLETAKIDTPSFGYVNQAVFSPDGDQVATANSDGSVSLWSEDDVRPMYGHSGDVWTVSFSPDGTLLASAGDKKAQIWDIQGREPRFLAEAGGFTSWINMAAFSPDSNYIVTANQDRITRVWEAATGEELFLLSGHRDLVWSAQFSPDGNRVVTASEDGTARIWNVDPGLELRPDTTTVDSAELSSDGSLILTKGGGEATVWDAATRIELLTFDTVSTINSVKFVGEGDRVVTASDRGAQPVELWDARTGKRLRVCCEHEDSWLSDIAVFSPVPDDDRVVVLYSDGSARIWDLSAPKESVLQSFGGRSAPLIGVDFSPDGKRILTVGRDDKRVRVWNSATGIEIGDGLPAGLVSTAFSPTGRRVVTGGTDGLVRVWDVTTGTQVKRLLGSAGAVSSVAYSPDGDRIVAGGSDGTIHIWNAGKLRLLAVLRTHADGVNSVAIDRSDRIISASDDGTVKIRDCQECLPLDRLVERAVDSLKLTDPEG